MVLRSRLWKAMEGLFSKLKFNKNGSSSLFRIYPLLMNAQTHWVFESPSPSESFIICPGNSHNHLIRQSARNFPNPTKTYLMMILSRLGFCPVPGPSESRYLEMAAFSAGLSSLPSGCVLPRAVTLISTANERIHSTVRQLFFVAAIGKIGTRRMCWHKCNLWSFPSPVVVGGGIISGASFQTRNPLSPRFGRHPSVAEGLSTGDSGPFK